MFDASERTSSVAPVRAWVCLAAMVTLTGCTRDRPAEDEKSDPSPAAASPIVVFGVDGLEWDVILEMLGADRLPNLAALMQRGYYGELSTHVPTYSPVVWTTVATGKMPQRHGIYHFVRRDGNRQVLPTSADRKTKAVWNILTDYNKKVTTIGWWMTHPVEAVNGVMVAQTNTAAQLDTRAGKNIWKGTLIRGVPDQVYPPKRQDEMISILEDVQKELPRLVRNVFGEFKHPRGLLGQRLWGNCLWAFRADATYLRIAVQLAKERPLPDLTLLYFGGPDVVGHRFWRYRKPDLYRHRPTEQQIANFGRVIEDYYAFADRALGRLVSEYGADATFIVISDHGMKAVNLSARFDVDDPPSDINSGEHQDAPPGVFFAAGPTIRRTTTTKSVRSLTRDDLETVGSVLDITPTLLAMLRIPLGEDMEGHVLERIFLDEVAINRQPRPVATHDTPEFLAGRGQPVPQHPGERERIEQLRSLGYLGGEDEDD